MNVEFTNWGGDGKRHITPLVQYLMHRTQSNEGCGWVEKATYNAQAAHVALANLVELLVLKGVIAPHEVLNVVGAAWRNDDVKVAGPDATIDFWAAR